jgi:hypothetical protein
VDFSHARREGTDGVATEEGGAGDRAVFEAVTPGANFRSGLRYGEFLIRDAGFIERVGARSDRSMNLVTTQAGESETAVLSHLLGETHAVGKRSETCR